MYIHSRSNQATLESIHINVKVNGSSEYLVNAKYSVANFVVYASLPENF